MMLPASPSIGMHRVQNESSDVQLLEPRRDNVTISKRQHDSRSAPRPRPSPSRRRDKPQLSCNLCRRRKLRCDRCQPCSTCLSSGQACTYPLNRATVVQQRHPAATDSSMHERIIQLERLVKSMAQTQANQSSPAPAPGIGPCSRSGHDQNHTYPVALETPLDGRSDRGSLTVDASGVRYIGGDHWAAILHSIADIKDYFGQEEQLRLANSLDGSTLAKSNHSSSTNLARSHALLLYASHRPTSRAEILAALPPKSVVDRYISRYFNGQDLVSTTIHGPSFLQEYEAFWVNQNDAPFMWIALLFGMICMTILASESSDTTHDNESGQQSCQVETYREKIVQCLVAGEYTKAGPFALEAMIHYVYVEFALRTDAGKDIWFLLALEVNLAMRMGYHRDPSHFPSTSPLQGEMRRRVWVTVLLGDMLISSQTGMPRMISDSHFDTAEPRNLNDADMDKDSTELPSTRPETEYTTALSLIARRRMLMALGAVSDLLANSKSYSYAEVMRVDDILKEAASSTPQRLKVKDITASITDSPQLIMARLFNSHMFYKGQIMLHRRFLFMDSPTQTADAFAYSRGVCLNASLSILQIQHILEEETCPGGQLHMMRWRVSSILNHQFLTATMILCSLLHRGQFLHRKRDMIAALRTTRTIWMRGKSVSHEARMAFCTIDVVLEKIGESLDIRPDRSIEDTSKAGRSMIANSSATANGRESGTGISQDVDFQDMMNLDQSDSFVMLASFSDFLLPEQQDHEMNFNETIPDGDTALDDWIRMNGLETGW